MANNTNWLNISQMTGGTGETALSLTALTNDSLSAKTATIVAKNSQYNVSGTSTVTIQGFQPTLTLSRSTLRFDSTGGTATFTVYSNTAWTINFPDLVYSYSTSAGTGDTEVTVVLVPNPEDISKVEVGTVQDVFNVNQLYLTIVQESFIAELSVEPDDDIIFDNTGSSSSVTITSNTDWEIECPSWVVPSVITGASGSTTVIFTTGENGPTDRSGQITVYAGSKEVTINVFQPFYIEPYITVTPSAWTFNYTEDGKTFIVDSYPEWTGEIVSTGETTFDDNSRIELTMDIPSSAVPFTISLPETGVVINGVVVSTTSYTFYSPGHYKLKIKNANSTTASNFSSYTYITEAVFKDGITTIPRECLTNCSSLSSVTLGKDITTIGVYAFTWCSSLTKIDISAPTAPSIDRVSFQGVATGGTLTYPEGSDYSSWLDIHQYYLGYYNWNNITYTPYIVATYNVTSTTNPTKIVYNTSTIQRITLEDDTTIVNVSTAYTFPETGLQTLHIYNTGGTPFSNCTDLVAVATNEYCTGGNQFSGCTSLSSITLNEKTTGLVGFSDCISLSSITLPSGITSIPNYCFSNCTSLSSITLPSGVTTIGGYAFHNCPLSSITLPSGVTSIDGGAFADCSSLSAIVSENPVAPAVTSQTFKNVATGGTLTYPVGSDYSSWLKASQYYLGYYHWNNVTYRDYILATYNVSSTTQATRILGYTTGIQQITLEDGTEIPLSKTYTFGSTGLQSLKMYFTYNYLSYDNFSGCTALVSIQLSDLLTWVAGICRDCTALTSVTLSNSLEFLGNDTFRGCTALSSITLPSSLTEIRDACFSGCTALSSITLPNNLTDIGQNCFRGCAALTSITIPSKVTTIKSAAFANCSALTSITAYSTTSPSIQYDTFYKVGTNGNLFYPNGSNYSTWLKTTSYYLGFYNWTGQEI